MKTVAIETPYAGDTERNLTYLRACLRDSIQRGEAPFASHGLYTQPGVLDDDDPDERALGIRAGFEWASRAIVRVFYIDLGISDGMRQAQDHARAIGQPIVLRRLGPRGQRETE